MIAINERQQRGPRADRGDREVAAARPALEDKAARGPVQPPSIQAAPDDRRRSPTGDFLGAGTGYREEDRTGGDARRWPRPALPSADGRAAELAVRNAVGRKGPTRRGRAAAGQGAVRRQAARGSPAKRRQIGRQSRRTKASAGGLLRHQPRGRRNQAFDKLLEANGVVWYRQRGQSGPGMEADQRQTARGRAG